MSNNAPRPMQMPGARPQGELIQVPNTLRMKVGPKFAGLDAAAIAKAEAALKSLSSQFGEWLQDELNKLDAARAKVHASGLTAETGEQLYTHAHDLKGLGATYEFPIVTRLAGSLCKLIDSDPSRTKAPLKLIDAHIDTIKAAVRDNIRDDKNPMGRALADELENQVSAYIAADKGSTTRP